MIFNKLVFVCVFSCLSTSLMGMFELLKREDYQLAQLIQARAVWLGQEENVEALKSEAACSIRRFTQCYNECGENFAAISAQRSLVRTYTEEENISLSYAEFDLFIKDEKLRNQAVVYKRLLSQEK